MFSFQRLKNVKMHVICKLAAAEDSNLNTLILMVMLMENVLSITQIMTQLRVKA